MRESPGQLVNFGSYPHGAAGTDRTPIQWRVLRATADEMFLLSEFIIDCQRYHHAAVDISWRDCDLRRWLNSDLYSAAFTPDEQARIRTTLCADNGHDSPDTEDRLFLLSVAEVVAYTDPLDERRRRAAIGTEYAKAARSDGRRLYVYDKGVEQDYLIVDGRRLGCSWWWTRTQSQRHAGNLSTATFIGARGNIKRYGQVDIRYYGVRPAIKLER